MKAPAGHVQSAFILAGGLGTRLRPLTLSTAKTLLPVAGKPIIAWNIGLCAAYGISHVVLGIGHLAQQFPSTLGDGKEWGVSLSYSVEKEFLGTAGALKLAQAQITGDDFVMMNGDEVKDVDLGSLEEVHRNARAMATIALVEVPDVSEYGIVEFSGDRVKSFREKDPSNHGRGWISAGAYVLSSGIFRRIPAGQSVSIEKDVFVPLAQEGRLACAKVVRQWYSTDTIERYEAASLKWTGRFRAQKNSGGI